MRRVDGVVSKNMPCDLACLVLGRSSVSDLVEFDILKQSVCNAQRERCL